MKRETKKWLNRITYSVYVSIVVPLIILKIVGILTWSWLWVTSFIWIPLVLGIVFFAGVGIKFLAMKKYNM